MGEHGEALTIIFASGLVAAVFCVLSGLFFASSRRYGVVGVWQTPLFVALCAVYFGLSAATSSILWDAFQVYSVFWHVVAPSAVCLAVFWWSKRIFLVERQEDLRKWLVRFVVALMILALVWLAAETPP